MSESSCEARVKKKLKRIEDPAFKGFPKPLPKNQLPTYQDVGLAIEEYEMQEEDMGFFMQSM